MKRKRSKAEIIIIAFIVICSFVSYIYKYPNEALKASCAGIGALTLYCVVGYVKDRLKKG